MATLSSIDVARITVETIILAHPSRGRDMQSRGIVAEITLASPKTVSLVYEWIDGQYTHAYGSYNLYQRWRKQNAP